MQLMRSGVAEPCSTYLVCTPNLIVIAVRPSWHGMQLGLVPALANPGPEPCPDSFHCSTYGVCVPVWQPAQDATTPVSTWKCASGWFASMVGVSTWVKPGPWQLSHCTS